MKIREIVIYSCERCGYEQAFPKLDNETYITANKHGWNENAIPVRKNSYLSGETIIHLCNRLLCAKCSKEFEQLRTAYHERVMEWYDAIENDGL